jgi:hypothetical protein
VTAIGDFFRERAAAHRATAPERPDDPRPQRSADALDDLAEYADTAAEEGLFQMRYLLEHHVVDGTFAWPEGQSGRAASRWGFDQPVYDPIEREQFLMDLCDLARNDACRHIGDPQNGFERDDAEAIAERYGISLQLVHHAFDTGRGYAHLFAVGIPFWHDLGETARAQLAEMDGVKLVAGKDEQFPDEDEPPLLACNIVADDEAHARQIVARIIDIDPEALGVGRTQRVL